MSFQRALHCEREPTTCCCCFRLHCDNRRQISGAVGARVCGPAASECTGCGRFSAGAASVSGAAKPFDSRDNWGCATTTSRWRKCAAGTRARALTSNQCSRQPVQPNKASGIKAGRIFTGAATSGERAKSSAERGANNKLLAESDMWARVPPSRSQVNC